MIQSNVSYGLRVCAAAMACLFLSLVAATPAGAVPIYDTFGPLDTATFGGQGIPNEEVAISSQFVDGNVLITIAMSATQRYSNPALTNDGAGTYYATPGSNYGGAGESDILGALWNVNGYLKVEGLNGATPKLADYQITLLYDTDPGVNTPFGQLGAVDVTALILTLDPNATLLEESQNLLFEFLATDFPPYLIAPATPFDPNALGQYTFGIQVSRDGWGVETVAMLVEVVPEPSSVALALLGMATTVVAVGRRRFAAK